MYAVYLFISILIGASTFYLLSKSKVLGSTKPDVVQEFGVMVTNFGKDSYCIMFSKNGFLTKQAILTVVDISFFGEADRVYANTYLTGDYEEAVDYAQRFTSYEICVSHNQKIIDEVQALLEHYKHHPPENRYPSKPANPPIEIIIFKQPL